MNANYFTIIDNNITLKGQRIISFTMSAQFFYDLPLDSKKMKILNCI